MHNWLKKAVISLVLIIALAATTLPALAATEPEVPPVTTRRHPVGTELEYRNDETGRVIVGDSRTIQLFEYTTDRDIEYASYVSTWGGAYCWDDPHRLLNKPYKMRLIKKYVRGAIRATGSCKVFLFASVNDYNGQNNYEMAIEKADVLMATADKIYNYTQMYDGEEVHPTIFIMGDVGRAGRNVTMFNKYLRYKCKRDPNIYKYVNMPNIVEPGCVDNTCVKKNKKRSNLDPEATFWYDGAHYTDIALKRIYRYLKRY